jgi:hypothetical protein
MARKIDRAPDAVRRTANEAIRRIERESALRQSAIPAVVPVVGAVKFITAPPEKVKFRRPSR